MAKKVVWTNYIAAEAIFRFWYTLENNNFKNAIKKAQKEGRMNYSHMHNALYAGLYFPEKEFVYGQSTIKNLRIEREAKGALANYMSREEIIKNIHAMYECAQYIRENAPFGYNAKLFAKEFFKIGKEASHQEKIQKMNPKLILIDKPNQDEKTPNSPQRFNLSKKFAKKMRDEKVVFYGQTSEDRTKRLISAKHKYHNAWADFNNYLASRNITTSQVCHLEKVLNASLYRTILPFYNLDMEKLMISGNGAAHIKEYELHTEKFKLVLKVLKKSNDFSMDYLNKRMKEVGAKSRNDFMKKNKNFPESYKGFLNAFCEMLIQVYVFEAPEQTKQNYTLPEIVEKLMETIQKLNNQYQTSTSAEEKQEIELQMKNIQKAMEESNKHNI